MNTLLALLLLIPSLNADLEQLNEELVRSRAYDAQHEHYIDSLRTQVQEGDCSFETYLGLFDAYSSYKFDSAYQYVQKLEIAAGEDIDHRVVADIKKSFICFSAGLFKEAHDILSGIDNIQSCSKEVQAQYYSYYARLYMDLGSFADGVFYDGYTRQGIECLSRQLRFLTPQDTVDYYYARALQAMKQEQHREALILFDSCLRASTITDHEMAIAYSSMAYPAGQIGDKDAALHYMIMAAIHDLRGSVNEGVALRFVASMLHERGYSNEAICYINHAREDAEFYGARHRQMEINQILPIIEHEQLRREREQRLITIVLLVIVISVLVVLVILLLYLRRKLRALSEAHRSIHQMNDRLSELGRLKEEYIGNYLSWQSDLVSSTDAIHTHLLRLARERDLKAIVAYIESIPKQNRRQEFMIRFDRMFLNICPNFVENFNALLQPEFRIELKEGELLTTELRIFALVRLGITSNEKIAEVLDYSVNTVYAYKTKMRNRSLLNSEEFYAAAAKC